MVLKRFTSTILSLYEHHFIVSHIIHYIKHTFNLSCCFWRCTLLMKNSHSLSLHKYLPRGVQSKCERTNQYIRPCPDALPTACQALPLTGLIYKAVLSNIFSITPLIGILQGPCQRFWEKLGFSTHAKLKFSDQLPPFLFRGVAVLHPLLLYYKCSELAPLVAC